MDLNHPEQFLNIDRSNLVLQINGLPEQLQKGWELGIDLHLDTLSKPQRVILAGVGGAAMACDLIAAYLSPICKVPISVHRDYGLPAWAEGQDTLIINVSHSGNTGETISSFEEGKKKNCSQLIISTGGELAIRASQAGIPKWIYPDGVPSRMAIGWTFGLLLAACEHLGMIRDSDQRIYSQDDEIFLAIEALQEQRDMIQMQIPLAENPAKRLAGQFMNRWLIIYGSEFLAPVSRRWKAQINELAKAPACVEILPEADYNAVAGLLNPQDELCHCMVYFLQSSKFHEQNKIRCELTRSVYLTEGMNIDFFNAKGENRLAHQWTTLLFGDFVAYYLAMLYDIDPTPVDAVDEIRSAML